MKNKAQKNTRTSARRRYTDSIKGHEHRGILFNSAMGTLAAVAVLVASALLLSYILYMTADPSRYVTPAALSVLYISAFLGGCVAAKLNKHSSLLCGVCVGAMIALLGLLASLLLDDKLSADYRLGGSLALRSAVVVCSVIGAYVGAAKKVN